MATRRPHILHVYKDYWPPIVGGIEKTIHWLAHGCSDAYDVSVLVCSRDRANRVETDGPIAIHKIGEWGRFASAPASPGFPRALKDFKADILHFHHPNPTGEISYLLGRPRGPVVVTYHSDIVRQQLGLKVYGPWLRRFLDKADVILPTSPQYIDSSAFLRPLKEKCRVVPLGIPLKAFAESETRQRAAEAIRNRLSSEFLVLFVGQFREYKGLPYLIDALAQVEGITAVLVGDGPCRGEIESQIRHRGLQNRVVLPGRLPDEDVIDYFHACDAFVLPSHRRSEAFGIVQVEAMACGKPVVSTRLGTGVEYVNRDGETGFVVPPRDPKSLASALRRLKENPEERLRMGENARRRANEEFSVGTMVGRVRSVYESLLSHGAVD